MSVVVLHEIALKIADIGDGKAVGGFLDEGAIRRELVTRFDTINGFRSSRFDDGDHRKSANENAHGDSNTGAEPSTPGLGLVSPSRIERAPGRDGHDDQSTSVEHYRIPEIQDVE